MSAFLAILCLATTSQADEAGWLPEALGGLEAAGPVQALAPGDLYGYMDGGADILLELRIESLRVRRYAARGGDELVAELYHMHDPLAALGAYWLKGGRDGPGQALAWRGRHLLVATWRPGSKLSEAAARTLVELVSRQVPAAPPGESLAGVLDLLPVEGRLEGSLRVVRGPLGTEGFYTLGEGDVLRLWQQGSQAFGLMARYRDARGREESRLVVSYPTVDRARQAFEHLSTHLDPFLKTVSRSDALLVFTDGEGTQGKATLQGSRLDLVLGPVPVGP